VIEDLATLARNASEHAPTWGAAIEAVVQLARGSEPSSGEPRVRGRIA
jgi:hypothetical protein